MLFDLDVICNPPQFDLRFWQNCNLQC